MSDRTDMIELARRRRALKTAEGREELAKRSVDTTVLYLTVKEIAAQEGVTDDVVRYRMADHKPVQVPAYRNGSDQTVSWAHGYTEQQVLEGFASRVH